VMTRVKPHQRQPFLNKFVVTATRKSNVSGRIRTSSYREILGTFQGDTADIAIGVAKRTVGFDRLRAYNLTSFKAKQVI
jgi:hypothetical protein